MNNRVTIDPQVCRGKPCIRGMRYPVESVLKWLAAGMSIDDILADYADLEREDVIAALAFAAEVTSVNRTEPIAAKSVARFARAALETLGGRGSQAAAEA